MTTSAPIRAETNNPGWGNLSAPEAKKPANPYSPKGHSPRLALATAANVRAELVRVYKSAKAGDIKMDHATKFAYILELLSRQIERTDLEQRLIALETKANSK